MKNQTNGPLWPDLRAYNSILRMVQTPEGRRPLLTCAMGAVTTEWQAAIEERVGRDAWAFDAGLGGFIARSPMRAGQLRAWFPAMMSIPATPEMTRTVIQPVRPSQAGARPITGEEVDGCIRYPGGIEVRDIGPREGGKHAWGVVVRGEAGVVFTAASSEKARDDAKEWAVHLVAGAASHQSAKVRAAEDGIRKILASCAQGVLGLPAKYTGRDPRVWETMLAWRREICAHGRVLRELGGHTDQQLEALTEGVWCQTAVGASLVTTPAAQETAARLAGTLDHAKNYYLFPAHMRADVEAEYGEQAIIIPSAHYRFASLEDAAVASWRAIWARATAEEGTAPGKAMVRFCRSLCAELPGGRHARDVVASIEKALSTTEFTGETVEAAIALLVDRAEASTTAAEGEIAALAKTAGVADTMLEGFDVSPYLSDRGVNVAGLERAVTGMLSRVPRREELQGELASPSTAVRAAQGFRALLGNLCPPGGVSTGLPGLPGLLERMDRTLERWREQVLVSAESVSALRDGLWERVAAGKRYDQLLRLSRIGPKEEATLSATPPERGVDGLSRAWFPLKFDHGQCYSDGAAIDFTGVPHIRARMTEADPRLNAAQVQRVIDRSSTPRVVGRPVAMWHDEKGAAVVGFEARWRNLPDAPEQTAVVPILASYVRYFRSKHGKDVQFEVPTPVYRATGVMVTNHGRPLGLVVPLQTPAMFESEAGFEHLMQERARLADELGVAAAAAAAADRPEIDVAA